MLDFVVALMVMALGLLISVAIDTFSQPIGGAEKAIWSEHKAQIVSAALGWLSRPWLIFVSIVAGFWVDLCSATKRARDLGIEVRSPLLMPLHLFNPFSQASLGRLIASPGIDGWRSGAKR